EKTFLSFEAKKFRKSETSCQSKIQFSLLIIYCPQNKHALLYQASLYPLQSILVPLYSID
ncbi:MAG: hypothetical protein ABI855_12235, partial [Bacteroidota bacterium]